MWMMRKKNWPARLFVHVLWVAFLCLTYPGAKSPAAAAARGATTSGEAARSGGGGNGNEPFTLRGWQPTAEFMTGWVLADTTEVDFPDEGEGQKHLVRDVAVFVMVAVFVGYFIAKVFLEGDTDEPAPPDHGKDIPATDLVD
jgi:hypothetical protein